MEKQTIHFNPPLGGHLLEDININSNTNMLRMKKLVVRLLLILMLMQILKITI